MKIGIIGFGTVGRGTHYSLAQAADFLIYDKNPDISLNTLEETVRGSEILYLCVPTPMNKDGSFSPRIIDEVMQEVHAVDGKPEKQIIIIKSTCIPGTTQKLIDRFDNPYIIFNPEFLTMRSYLLDSVNPSRIIFGISKDTVQEIGDKLIKLLKPKFPAVPFWLTDPLTAEMVKYTSNCFFATKVGFLNEIYQICDKIGVKYDRLIKMVLADSRMGNSHFDVPGHDGRFGFGGLCFPKDINAFKSYAKSIGVDPKIMDAVWEKNLEVRPEKDWEQIEGVVDEE
jgi:UDPglucose 6-dehydrogenase